MRLRLTPSTPSIRTCTEWSRGATDRPTVGWKSVRHVPRSRLHDYLRTGSAGSMSHRIGRAAGAHQIPGGGSSHEYLQKNDVWDLSRGWLITVHVLIRVRLANMDPGIRIYRKIQKSKIACNDSNGCDALPRLLAALSLQLRASPLQSTCNAFLP